MKTDKGLHDFRAAHSPSDAPGKSLPPRFAAASSIVLAALATLMLIATSCSVARL